MECHLKTDKDIATTDNTVELKDEISIIRSIVDTLPPLQAQVFRMKEIEGYENEELIKIIGCSPDSLRQNLSRARKKIREEFIKIRNK
jgi:RNA polymerase sigma-70 factor (ECF subfamily)